jgi:hypothetical protein
MRTQYFIQYHNTDNLGFYPGKIVDINTPINNVVFDNSVKYASKIFTSKKIAENSVGGICFLIVGKTEARIKNYYLWSCIKIESVKKRNDSYLLDGISYDIKKPVLLNNILDFESFKHFTGNFGLGFQNINNHKFSSTLKSLTKIKKGSFDNTDSPVSLEEVLLKLHNKMKNVKPERRVELISRILRNDKQMVETLKRVSNYKCQFPNCRSVVQTKEGLNYVEVAHIKPVKLGGQSILGNLIVLCPNHHKEFDYGNLIIETQTDEILSGSLNSKNFQIKFKKR